MSTQAYAWQSIVVTYTNSSGQSATVAEVKVVPAPQFTAEDIDVTSQDSGNIKEFIPGMKEGNEIEFIGNDVPSDTGQGYLAEDAANGANGHFALAFPSGSTIEFNAAIKTFDIIEDNGAGAFSCKVKVSGSPSRSSTLVKLSALTTTAGTLFPPTFAPDTYTYTITALPDTSTCTVTPTSEGATIYVNGKAVTSGVASGNINLLEGGVTQISVNVRKSGSVSTTYRLIVSREASGED